MILLIVKIYPHRSLSLRMYSLHQDNYELCSAHAPMIKRLIGAISLLWLVFLFPQSQVHAATWETLKNCVSSTQYRVGFTYAGCYIDVGWERYDAGDDKKAEEYAKEALRFANTITASNTRNKALNLLAATYIQLAQYDDADTILKVAIDEYEKQLGHSWAVK